MKASYLRHASHTVPSSLLSLYYMWALRPPSFSRHRHVCTLTSHSGNELVSALSLCTHIFIRMWLLEMTGSLGNGRLKLKSSSITLKGTISHLNSGSKGRASLVLLYMQMFCTERPLLKGSSQNWSKHFCCKLHSAAANIAFGCVIRWLSFIRLFLYVCCK